MPKNHDQISIDELLNYEGAETAKTERYQRLMQHRTNEAMNGLSNRLDQVVLKLVGVMETVHRVGQLAQEKADAAIEAGRSASDAQTSQQKTMKWLTVALVGCTVVYTSINGWVAYEMKEGNAIQREVAAAARDQAAAAREGIDLQKHSVKPDPVDTLAQNPQPSKSGKKSGTRAPPPN